MKQTFSRIIDGELRQVEFDLSDRADRRNAERMADFFDDAPVRSICPVCGDPVTEDDDWTAAECYYHTECWAQKIDEDWEEDEDGE